MLRDPCGRLPALLSQEHASPAPEQGSVPSRRLVCLPSRGAPFLVRAKDALPDAFCTGVRLDRFSGFGKCWVVRKPVLGRTPTIAYMSFIRLKIGISLCTRRIPYLWSRRRKLHRVPDKKLFQCVPKSHFDISPAEKGR